jgi:seryl-tRNA synthetase
MLDLHTREHGYTEVCPPFVVNSESMRGTGQLPRFAEDLYQVPADGLWLIPTAEVPVTNIHRGEILDAAVLPLLLRVDALFPPRGGAAVGHPGLLRVHQFDKVELVRVVGPRPPTRSQTHHEPGGTVLQRLGLPYRVLELASGDTGFASARTYDLETWAPGVGTWLEVSSASTFTDFQARRLELRYRPAAGAKPELVHTLNASGVAFPRTIATLLEHYQQADGSVLVPPALAAYLGADRLVPR